MRRAAKWGAVLVLLLVLIAAGLFGYRTYRLWTTERLVARAETANLTEWETGKAVRLTYRVTVETDGTAEPREAAVTCFRKREVDLENGRPRVSLVHEPLGHPPGFRFTHAERGYHLKPAGSLCDLAFEPDLPGRLPLRFASAIEIRSLLDDGAAPPVASEANTLFRHYTALSKVCRVNWPGERPIALASTITLSSPDLVAAERVPMRDALPSPDLMGPVEAWLNDFVDGFFADPFLGPDWSADEGCWLRGTGGCDDDAGWDCGYPRL